jgi:trans-aconitate methyltransferase
VTREQGLVFGEGADEYDALRPSNPDAVFDHVMRFGALQPGDRAVEVGAGTGKATRSFLQRGLSIHALEPSPEMAAVLRRHGVDAETTRFEHYSPTESFRLLYAAQSWHWITGEDRYDRAAAALAPGGTIALLWNKPREWDGELGAANDALYAQYAPHLEGGAKKWEIGGVLDEMDAHTSFAGTEHQAFAWAQQYTGADYVRLLGTMSDHRMLPEETRRALHTAIDALVDEHGGRVEVTYDTNLSLAVRRGSSASQ